MMLALKKLISAALLLHICSLSIASTDTHGSLLGYTTEWVKASEVKEPSKGHPKFLFIHGLDINQDGTIDPAPLRTFTPLAEQLAAEDHAVYGLQYNNRVSSLELIPLIKAALEQLGPDTIAVSYSRGALLLYYTFLFHPELEVSQAIYLGGPLAGLPFPIALPGYFPLLDSLLPGAKDLVEFQDHTVSEVCCEKAYPKSVPSLVIQGSFDSEMFSQTNFNRSHIETLPNIILNPGLASEASLALRSLLPQLLNTSNLARTMEVPALYGIVNCALFHTEDDIIANDGIVPILSTKLLRRLFSFRPQTMTLSSHHLELTSDPRLALLLVNLGEYKRQPAIDYSLLFTESD